MRRLIQGTSKGEHIDGTRRADEIYGKGGDDGIGGHRGDDLIDGGAGDDRLHGGEDHDKLIGGTGDDTFIFRSFAPDDSDRVVDFKHKADNIELDASIFTALDAGQLLNSEFVLGSKALDKNDYVIYNPDTGKLYYDDDGSGAHQQHLIATLDNLANLSASDIDIVWPT